MTEDNRPALTEREVGLMIEALSMAAVSHRELASSLAGTLRREHDDQALRMRDLNAKLTAWKINYGKPIR